MVMVGRCTYTYYMVWKPPFTSLRGAQPCNIPQQTWRTTAVLRGARIRTYLLEKVRVCEQQAQGMTWNYTAVPTLVQCTGMMITNY